MKIGLGLYRHQLDRAHFDFARQCGATHLVVHLVDYFGQGDNPRDNQPTGGLAGWGRAGDPSRLWTVEELRSLKQEINAAGLELEAIENFDPAHWYDVLLDGPCKQQQLENLKTIVRRLGGVGIPVMGYNFSIAGVASRIKGPFARGNAVSVGMDGVDETPVPLGMVWNMVYDRDAPGGTLPEISHAELWRRLEDFLAALLPVAEEVDVKLAAHPDDPPVPRVRRQPRLVYQPDMYQRMIDLNPSPANTLEFCVGTLAEMIEGDVYETAERHSKAGRIAYVHLRNITGKAPRYRETFIDDGDVDIARVLSILLRNGFDGVVIPDHTPQMACQAPWHAGMAHALGFIQGVLRVM
ncbi:MAG: mannonate dehydratase [Phycisphaerales bacterium]|nr:MAG: mannonate dehydratase [Phycisphaerales bacterium]